jgi:hypothetical protein
VTELSKPLAECGWQCCACASFVQTAERPIEKNRPTQCTECGCRIFRAVTPGAPRDRPSPESVAHLKKPVESCWNYDEDPNLGKVRHKLELVDVVDSTNPDLVIIKSTCKHCDMVYHQTVIPRTRVDLLKEHGLESLAKPGGERHE